MAAQTSWLIEQRLLQVHVSGTLRGYAADQLSKELMNFVTQCPRDGRMHIMIDVSQMEASRANVELLYLAITPLLLERQLRWIVFYSATQELGSIFKGILSDLFRNPCVLLENYDAALDFLYRRDKRLLEMHKKAS